jgi:hypothetical protein
VIEVLAAITGASISVAFMGMSSASRRATDGRDAVIRLTEAVNSLGTRLDELHIDLKASTRETYGRLGTLEQRVAKLEAKS